jgi:hypothetical protein
MKTSDLIIEANKASDAITAFVNAYEMLMAVNWQDALCGCSMSSACKRHC